MPFSFVKLLASSFNSLCLFFFWVGCKFREYVAAAAHRLDNTAGIAEIDLARHSSV